MDLRSAYPYWLLKDGIIKVYPSLQENANTEIVIIGGGVTGAIVAWHLCKAGFKVIVVDRRHIGMGSTAACTGLLQYEIDTPLHKLIDMVGERNAVGSYLLCERSIYDLQKICAQLADPAGFIIKPSFQFASLAKHARDLENEYNARKRAGIEVSLLDEGAIKKKYGFKKNAGLLSTSGAEINAYRLTHNLLMNCSANGLRVFDHTEIIRIDHQKSTVVLHAKDGFRIKAKQLIIACGYESQKYLPAKVESIYSTYSIVSEPMTGEEFWYKNSLIWETAQPYLYFRTTRDNRVMAGGMDDHFSDPVKRDKGLGKKSKQLEQKLARLFPHIPFKTDFSWAGAFAATKDGLPYIGPSPNRPNTWFALGFGGNGVVFSILAAQLITAALKGKPSKDMEIFRFNR